LALSWLLGWLFDFPLYCFKIPPPLNIQILN